MTLPWLERIGVRLALALAAVLVLLAVVANAITNLAFDRAARTVEQQSAAELEALARSSLLEITEREAQLIANAMERSATLSRVGASYLGRRLAAGDGASLLVEIERIASGHWTNPDPERRSVLHVPDSVTGSLTALEDAAAGAILDDFLSSLQMELGDAVGVYWVSPEGVTRYYPPIDFAAMVQPDFDPTVQPIFLLGAPEVNPERETRWTPPYVDDVGNGLLVTAVTPVYAEDDFRGVVDVDVSLARLANRLASIAPLEGSFAFLIDAEGRLITASPGAVQRLGYVEVPFGALLDAPETAPLLDRIRAPSSGVSTAGAATGAAAKATAEGTAATASAADARAGAGAAAAGATAAPGIVIAHAPVPGTDWFLALGAPLEAVSAPARQVASGLAVNARLAQRSGAIALLAAFLLALAVLMAATRAWVARPVAALATGAARIGEGDFDAPVPVDGHGELRVLGEAFHRMSGALAAQRAALIAHQQDLERQIADGTRARLLQAREASALEERQHLARELHDSVSQALFGVVLGLETAKRELPAPGRLRTSVDYASELADAALKEMRALIFELRPEALDSEGLTGLLKRQAEMLRARHDLAVDLDVVEPALPIETKAAVYRVAQEALHNVAKHAHARTVSVRLTTAGGTVQLEVRDDGKGFGPGAARADAFGLVSMRERIGLHGGTFEVTSGPGQGTTIRASLPVMGAGSPPVPMVDPAPPSMRSAT